MESPPCNSLLRQPPALHKLERAHWAFILLRPYTYTFARELYTHTLGMRAES